MKKIKLYFSYGLSIYLFFATTLTLIYADWSDIILGFNKDMDSLKLIADKIILGLLIAVLSLPFFWLLKKFIKSIIEDTVDKIERKVEKRYKAFTEVFSSFIIKASINNRVVMDIILPKIEIKDEELAEDLYDKNYYLNDIKKQGFDDKIIDLIKKKYLEEELENLKKKINESN